MYFRITEKSQPLREEIKAVRKNNAQCLIPVANRILDGKAPDAGFLIDENPVGAEAFAREVLQESERQDSKFKAAHKRIWIQQGVCSNSGHYKWVRA